MTPHRGRADGSSTTITWTGPNGRQYTPDQHGYITGAVNVTLGDVINGALEAFLDLLSDALTGPLLLVDIGYRLVGIADEATIRLEVTGDPQQIQADDDGAVADIPDACDPCDTNERPP